MSMFVVTFVFQYARIGEVDGMLVSKTGRFLYICHNLAPGQNGHNNADNMIKSMAIGCVAA